MRRLALALGVVAIVAASVGPLAWMLSTSLKSPSRVAERPPTLLPDGDLSSYRAVFGRHRFPAFAANSFVVAGATTLLAVTLGAFAAYPLSRSPAGANRLVLGLLLAASMFPPIAVVGGIYRLLAAGGLLNTRTGLVLAYTALTLPMAVWLLATFFRAIPRDLEDAARVDGCGPVATLLRVFLPAAAPAVFTTAILIFIYAWNEFFLALLVMTSESVQTLPVGIAKFPGEHLVPWGELNAAAVVATLPLVLLVLLLQRRIISGLTAGAVKG